MPSRSHLTRAFVAVRLPDAGARRRRTRSSRASTSPAGPRRAINGTSRCSSSATRSTSARWSPPSKASTSPAVACASVARARSTRWKRRTCCGSGLADGSDFIARLAEAVAERTAPLGVERSARSFRPHLTLARFRARTDVADLIAAIGDAPVGPEWEVDAIIRLRERAPPRRCARTSSRRRSSSGVSATALDRASTGSRRLAILISSMPNTPTSLPSWSSTIAGMPYGDDVGGAGVVGNAGELRERDAERRGAVRARAPRVGR